MALAQALYSVSINIIFAFTKKSSDMTKYQIAINIGRIFFILLSGFLLSSEIKNSVLILSITSSIIYIISAIPLFYFYKDLKDNYLIRKELDKKIKIDKWFIIFHIMYGLFQPVIDNLLPLYLYLNNLSFESVTIVIALIELFKILSNYLSHILIKKKMAILSVCLGSVVFILSGILLLVFKNSLILYILSITCSLSFPLCYIPMFMLYSNYLKDNSNVFYGMRRRDINIFSFRPVMYLLSYIGLSLYPAIIFGLLSIPVMLYSEILLIKKYEGNNYI